jgi:hypothetical protein
MPKVSFGIIVLNGEPFTRYCLRALYPFAHEIIVVEGGHEDTRAVTTPDGHSIDDTRSVLERFCSDEDPQGKVTIVTKDGFWPKTDEYGKCRTAQSRAYAERATGDYLWQVDIDEFYREEDIRHVLEMLAQSPDISAMTFRGINFWGSLDIEVYGWAYQYSLRNHHRLFRWGPGYRYVTHEPPTVVDSEGRDLRALRWIGPKETAREGIHVYHYSLLFPWQVEQKTRLYEDERPVHYAGMHDWAKSNYFELRHPYHVHHMRHIGSWSWLKRYSGDHPTEIRQMMDDIREGRVQAALRENSDAYRLLDSWWYRTGAVALEAAYYVMRAWKRARRVQGALRRRPGKMLRWFASQVQCYRRR